MAYFIKSFILSVCFLLLTNEIDGRQRPLLRRTTRNPEDEIESWTGEWFPGLPHHKDTWIGKWFPHSPYESRQNQTTVQRKLTSAEICDNGKDYIGKDYDPNDLRQSYQYLCLANRTLYVPSMKRNALRTEFYIPPAYVPPIKCLNETIRYETTLPTYGAFRPILPKYGAYKYLPPQRWLLALAQGAIVMVYHPCASAGQVTELETILSACMYRHIITPSQGLSPERPLALLAWGKMLKLSVVDRSMVVDFIKQNAKQGPIGMWKQSNTTQKYEAGLLQEAHLVTDVDDAEICGYIQEM